eukprot:m.43580 g.43580  ORF g.43580 m.43580 type:complete len:187 (+) comp7118_c0_seq2:362-922(+)
MSDVYDNEELSSEQSMYESIDEESFSPTTTIVMAEEMYEPVEDGQILPQKPEEHHQPQLPPIPYSPSQPPKEISPPPSSQNMDTAVIKSTQGSSKVEFSVSSFNPVFEGTDDTVIAMPSTSSTKAMGSPSSAPPSSSSTSNSITFWGFRKQGHVPNHNNNGYNSHFYFFMFLFVALIITVLFVSLV